MVRHGLLIVRTVHRRSPFHGMLHPVDIVSNVNGRDAHGLSAEEAERILNRSGNGRRQNYLLVFRLHCRRGDDSEPRIMMTMTDGRACDDDDDEDRFWSSWHHAETSGCCRNDEISLL